MMTRYYIGDILSFQNSKYNLNHFISYQSEKISNHLWSPLLSKYLYFATVDYLFEFKKYES